MEHTMSHSAAGHLSNSDDHFDFISSANTSHMPTPATSSSNSPAPAVTRAYYPAAIPAGSYNSTPTATTSAPYMNPPEAVAMYTPLQDFNSQPAAPFSFSSNSVAYQPHHHHHHPPSSQPGSTNIPRIAHLQANVIPYRQSLTPQQQQQQQQQQQAPRPPPPQQQPPPHQSHHQQHQQHHHHQHHQAPSQPIHWPVFPHTPPPPAPFPTSQLPLPQHFPPEPQATWPTASPSYDGLHPPPPATHHHHQHLSLLSSDMNGSASNNVSGDHDAQVPVLGAQGMRGLLPFTKPGDHALHSSEIKPVKVSDKPVRYECPGCYKQYSHSKHVLRHYMRHTGEKPHQCHYCQREFTRTDLLKRHFAKCAVAHGGDPSEDHLQGVRGGRRRRRSY